MASAPVPASLLPPNATPLEQAVGETIAIQIGALTAPLRDLWNPATCPEPLLPWLAWSLAVESWNSTWPEAVKRARIASAIAIHRTKGTVQAVRDVIAAYGGTVKLTVWYETSPAGDPFTFALSIALGAQAGAAPDADFITGLIDDVTRAKGARDTFTFTVALNAIGAIGLFAAARPATYARLECAATNH
jgi:phage tail P2-like protein